MKKIFFLLLLLTLLFSCKTNNMSDLLIETDSISLFHGETAVIRASSDNGLLYYKSSNNFIATVDEKGVVTANIVGIAEISVQDGKEAKVCKVTVKPQFFISIHPFINFGASIAEVKNTVKDVFIEELTMSDNSAKKVLIYYNQKEDEKSCIVYEYHFLNDKLISTGVFVNNGVDFFNDLIHYLDETYYYEGEYKNTGTNSAFSYQRSYLTIDKKSYLDVFYKIPVTDYYLVFLPT